MQPLADQLKDPRFAPCQAVVIERLDNYKPDESRGRRENRMLAAWRKAELKKRLTEECELHGLQLREMPANYTSRQCSRTGLPGIRCDDVPLQQFLMAPWWRAAVNRADRRIKEKKASAQDFLLKDLDTHYGAITGQTDRSRLLRLPQRGGELFVAAPPSDKPPDQSVAPRFFGPIQADLNAAANIGLRALLDPDFAARWWYVPCSVKNGTPAKEKVAGTACFLNSPSRLIGTSTKPDGKREYLNAWHDVSRAPLPADGWAPTTEYWNKVRARTVAALRIYNGIQAHATAS